MSNEKIPQHKEEKEFDPVPKSATDAEPDFDAEETDEYEEGVDDIPESELEDAAGVDD